jgi:hypothetical protein
MLALNCIAYMYPTEVILYELKNLTCAVVLGDTVLLVGAMGTVERIEERKDETATASD